MFRWTRQLMTVCAASLALVGTAATAHAQLNGENLLGDMGVKSGTQPGPGFYAGYLFYRYRTDSMRDANGKPMVIDPTATGSQSIDASVPLVIYVSKAKLFGANIGMMAVLPIASGMLEAPGLGLYEEADKGMADAYIMPLQLGWHTSRADITSGFAFFTPNGRYEADASDNLGKGMWSYELSAGATVYLDRARTISAATMASWETHSKKSGTANIDVGQITLSGVRPGQLMTIEGGAAKSFLHGAAHLGVAYYAQWKMTADDLGAQDYVPSDLRLPRHRVFALGPDVSIPVATKSRLVSIVNVRYLIETGAHVKTQGSTFLLTTTFPLPSVKLPGAR